ncbi:MAG: hypothetical protein JO084_02780 [Bradyrhizobiaceae bacterium]|nr:hypothetical protein [Hyphomicrobiales bacterium]MBV9426636.1 hypothetical protein [Bradyrhizobiaceae bacterium]
MANQFLMGLVPYRDLADINMPLVYAIHAAVVAIGGMSDLALRTFDLLAAAGMSALIMLLVRPAGWAAALLALLAMLATHLLLGPYAAGQRDYLIAILALAVAWFSVAAGETSQRRGIYLMTAGATAMIAASLKPSALLLGLLPALTIGPPRIRDAAAMTAGALGAGFAVFGTLAALGGLGHSSPCCTRFCPAYASLDHPTFWQMLFACAGLAPLGGLAVASALAMVTANPARTRAMMGVAAFGVIHLLVQRKGFFYHVYPLGVGLACWGAVSLAALPRWRALACLALVVATVTWQAVEASRRIEPFPEVRAAGAMQAALESQLPRGARVQAIDSDRGGLLAMARAGMRQATRHMQSFSLILTDDAERTAFLAALAADPPAAILLTNDVWPQRPGFHVMEDWPEFRAFLTSHYEPRFTGHEDYIDWRLYLPRSSQAAG